MRSRCRRHIIPILLVLLLLPGMMQAQGSLAIVAVDTSRFPLMRATFFPLDPVGGRYNNLADYDLRLEEKGLARPLRLLDCPPQTPPRPVSSVLAIDISGSMGGERITIARDAARLWINELPLGLSECAVTSFDDRGYLNLDFTTDRARLLASLNGLIPRGGTNYDAGLVDLPGGAIPVARNGRARRVVVFLTDGQGRGNEAAIIAAARDANTTIYTVALGMSIPPILRSVATSTGGAWFEQVTTIEQARAVYRAILLDAQGILPCTVEWETTVDCDSVHRLVLLDNLHGVADTASYLVPAAFRPSRLSLQPSQPALSFGGVSSGGYSDLPLDLTAGNASVRLQGITVSDPRFTIITGAVPPAVSIPAGGSHRIVLRYTPTDSSFVFAQLGFISDGCTSPTVYLAAGYPGVPPLTPSLRLVAPNGGERFAVGSDVEFVWSGILPEDSVRLEYSTDAGATWSLVADKVAGLRYRWRVPPTPSNRCFARVVQAKPAGLDSVIVLDRHISGVEAVAFSRDGGLVATGGIDDTAWIWNAYTGARIRPVVGASRGIVSLEFNPDGRHLLVGSGVGYVQVFDVVSGQVAQILSGTQITSSAAYNTDGRLVASHSYNGEMAIWDTTTGGTVRLLVGHRARGFTVQFSPDGTRLVSGSFDSTARVWDVSTGSELALLEGHEGSVNSGVFSPDGLQVVTASSDNTIRFWTAATGANTTTVDDGDQLFDVAFSGNGALLASGGADRLVKLRDPVSGAILRTLAGHTERVTSVAFSSDGRRIVSGSFDNTARIWNLDAGALQSDSSDALWAIVAPVVDADDIDMGNVPVGSYRDSVVRLYLCNRGELAVRVDSIVTDGPDPADFSLVVSDAPLILSPGECRDIEFRFAPTASGIRTGGVIILVGGDTMRRAITGWGYRRRLEVERGFVDFGRVMVGRQLDTSVTAILRNIGPTPIDVVESRIAGPDFASFVVVGGGAPFTVAPGDAHAMNLRFVPQGVGGASSTISFATSTGDSGLVVALAGRGVCDTATLISTVKPAALQGRPGERIDLPIVISPSRRTIPPDPKRFLIRIQFDPDLLVSLRDDPLVYNHDSTRTIEISGSWSGTTDTLLAIPFMVALGRSDRADLRVTAFAWLDDCAPDLLPDANVLVVDGICRDGSGARLVRSGSGLLLKSIRPNPARRGAVVEYDLLEQGRTRIALFDIRGNETLLLLDTQASPGTYTITLDTDSLPAGRYFLKLETPTQQEIMEVGIGH